MAAPQPCHHPVQLAPLLDFSTYVGSTLGRSIECVLELKPASRRQINASAGSETFGIAPFLAIVRPETKRLELLWIIAVRIVMARGDALLCVR